MLRRVILSSLLFFVCVISGHVTIAHVQGNNNSGGGGTSLSVTLGSSTTAGDFLIAVSPNNNASVLPTGVTGCGTTWYPAPTTSANNNVAIFYAMNIPGGTCTATVSYPTSTSINLLVDEYSGMAGTYALDVTN